MNGMTSAKDKTHSREPSATPQDTNINLIRFIKKMKFGERTHSINRRTWTKSALSIHKQYLWIVYLRG